MISYRKNTIGFLLCALFGGALYISTIFHPFVYDDVFYVERNSAIRSTSSVVQTFLSPFSSYAPGLYRPITTISYQLDFAFAGLEPFQFHLTNILLHSAVIGLVFLLILSLLRSYTPALLGGLIFAAHPVHTEAVSWVSGRSELLACFFVLTAAILFLKHRYAARNKALLIIMAGVMYLFGLLSKEIAAPLPLALLVFELIRSKRPEWKSLLRAYATFVIAFLVYLPLRITALGALSVPAEHIRTAGLSMMERLLLMLPVLVRYIQLMVIPTGLRLEYDWGGFPVWVTLGSFVILAVIVVSTAWLIRKKYFLLTSAEAWFFLFLFPVMNIIPIGELIAERFLYLPSVALSILVGVLLVHGGDRWRKKGALFAVVVILIFSAMTIDRVSDWKNPEVLWRDTLRLSPSAPHALQNLSSISLSKGKFAEAADLIEQGITLYPESAMLHSIAAQVAQERGEVDRARLLNEKALELASPTDLAMTDFQRGSILLRLERHPEALEHFERALGVESHNPALFNNLGITFASLGRLDDAVEAFQHSISLYEAQAQRSREEESNYKGTLENLRMLRGVL